ncbi:universal stress protein [Streptomyces sp. NPDC025273]|uniref:universal stress protein n=1 Tax=unclassified Streptomyces TaxID=2593676 RepID=UPI0033D7FB35
MNRSITVGLDGSAESVAAARWAAQEAGVRGRPLLLVHCEEWSSPAGLPASGSDVRERWAQALLLEAFDVLHEAHPRLEIGWRSVDGPPAASLAGMAPGAEMLVLGSRGLGTLSGYVLGSVGLAVIRATERPVVLVRRTHESSGASCADRPVLVAVDVDRPCDALFAFAFEEAASRGCPLIALHSRPAPLSMGSGAGFGPEVTAEISSRARAGLQDVLKPWRDRFPAVAVEARAAIGRAAVQILEAGAGAGLIVVGRRVRGAPAGARIGPVTHAVVHHAPAPVVVIAHP